MHRKSRQILREGIHYYLDNGFMVFTELYLLEKGRCCGNCCRHCPYIPKHKGTAVLNTEQMLKVLQNKIRPLLENGPAPYIAAFDADGTLWSCDMGDEFLKNFKSGKHFEEYQKMRWTGGKREALIYACQVVKGMSPAEIDQFCDALFQTMLISSVFPLMQSLVAWLLQENVQIYIVTASPKWAVVPGAKYLGVPAERVLGLETSIVNGLYTDKLATPYTAGEGKVEAFRNVSADTPLLTAGNTPDDLHLLQLSKGLKLAVRSAAEGTNLQKAEQGLAEQALGEGWLQLDLRPKA